MPKKADFMQGYYQVCITHVLDMCIPCFVEIP